MTLSAVNADPDNKQRSGSDACVRVWLHVVVGADSCVMERIQRTGVKLGSECLVPVTSSGICFMSSLLYMGIHVHICKCITKSFTIDKAFNKFQEIKY